MATKITNAIVYMIAKDNQPLGITENDGFKKLMTIVAPLYKLPGRFKITALVREKFTMYANIVKRELEGAEWVSLTTDVWTDIMTTTSYVGLTVHYVSKGISKSIIIGVLKLDESHTAEYLHSKLSDFCIEWKIDLSKVVAIVTDSGANVVKAVHDLLDKRRHLPCLAHTINLVATTTTADRSIKHIIDKIKNIVTHFKQSVNSADQLRKAQQVATPLKLIQSVPTRWNSCYYMIQRFLELSDSVNAILLKNPKSPEALSAVEFQICKELLDILNPLEQTTKEISGETYVTSSKVIPLINCLKNKITEFRALTCDIQNVKQITLAEIQKRFGSIEDNKILACATILDPRFKKIHFNNAVACSQAINFINKTILEKKRTTVVHEERARSEDEVVENTNDIWTFHKKLSLLQNATLTTNLEELDAEFKLYLNTPTIALNTDPLQFWLQQQTRSHLANIALKYLIIPATSVPCERAFSQAGNILTLKRNRLGGDHLSQLMFLHSLDDSYWTI